VTTQVPPSDDAIKLDSPPSAVGATDLDRSLVGGIAWTGGVKAVTQALSWLSTLVVARLLSPTDYGICGMATIFIGLVQIVNEFGLSAAVVQRRDLSDEQISKLGGLTVLLGAVIFIVAVLGSPLVASFFGQPAVRDVVIVLSTTFLTSSFQVLPRSLLTRELRFRTLASVDAAEAVTQTIVTLVLAVLGWRYWSIVVGLVAGRIASTILALRVRNHRLSWPSPLTTIKDSVFFGAHVTGGSLAWYAFRSADMTVVGRRLGDVALGAYTIGWTLASLPVDKVASLVARATPAIFARVQDDRDALRRYVLSLTEGIGVIAVPASIGLALVAGDFLTGVLGARWQPAVLPLRILALSAILRSTVPILNQVLIATGQTRRNMQGTIEMAIVLPILFVVGSVWGTTGVAVVWLLGYPVASFAFYSRHALQTCGLSLVEFLQPLAVPTVASVAMSAVVLLIHQAWPSGGLIVRLVLEVVAGAGVYVGIVYAVRGARIISLIESLRAQA